MGVRREDVEMYSRNKNVVFETGRRRGRMRAVATKTGIALARLKACPTRIVLSARVIEYPLVFQYLDKSWTSILDFGCVEDLLPIHLASIGYKVTGLDFRPYPFTHRNFQFIQSDILTWLPPREQYDCVLSISTIEHVGLGGYRDPVQKDGDKIAVAKLMAALKPHGKAILTLPFGRPTIKRNMRVYDYDMLHKLVPSIETERFYFKSGRYAEWAEATWQEINKLEYENYYALSPTQGCAFVVARRD